MKRRELFKMFATLAAMPLVARALPVESTPKPSMALDKFADWPAEAQKHLLKTLQSMPPVNDLIQGSYGDGESSDVAFLRLSLNRFWQVAFRFHDAQKFLLESPTIMQALDCFRGTTRVTPDVIFGCRIERWILPLGEILIPEGELSTEFPLTHKNTIYETNYPSELSAVQRDLMGAILSPVRPL